MFYVHMLLKAFELYNFVCVSECVLCGVCVCVCVCERLGLLQYSQQRI